MNTSHPSCVVLDAIQCTTRVLVMEYNAHFGPTARVTLPPGATRVGKTYFGASLAALTDVAARNGYDLICCEPMGVNAFFVRRDLATCVPSQTAQQAYWPPMAERGLPDDVFGDLARRQLSLVTV
jgi:hypothetical protein